MHPAPSIIVFTVLSGLGFGTLFFLGLGVSQPTGWAGFFHFALAAGLAVAGLFASVFHLGHPERALKAFSQWRSSWLSREAWAATAALIAAGLYGAGLVFWGVRVAPLGLLLALLSLVTVAATSMIYAQLKTVPRWNHWSTPGLFGLYMLSGGAILTFQGPLAIALLLLTGGAQLVVWGMGDGRFAAAGHTMATATGLGARGAVRMFESPHTGTNYLLTEMVHVVGRTHALKLRATALVTGALIPALILFLGDTAAHFALAAAAHLIGALTARWLFFAQAEHVVGLYYGKR